MNTPVQNTKEKMVAVAFFIITALLASGFFISLKIADASEIGHYRATLRTDNVVGKNGWNDLGLALLGWSCSGSESIEFTELLADHKGRPKRVPKKVDSQFKYSLFNLGAPTVSEFNRDMNVEDPRLSMSLREYCTKTTGHWETTTNSRGETKEEYVTETQTAWMDWQCDTSNLPTRAGQAVYSQCTPYNSYFGDFGLESLLINMFRQKTFSLTLELKNIQEKYTRDLCQGSRENRVVISLKQGAGGHLGEDDFVFHVVIDGKHKFDIKNDSGILNEEIAYCGAGDTVTVEVDATEEDLFFDDEYKSSDAALLVRKSREAGARGSFQKIELSRKTYFGEVFTDKKSEVEVSLREAP
jgi:hypothetical protein